jgi:hypothetical protein
MFVHNLAFWIILITYFAPERVYFCCELLKSLLCVILFLPLLYFVWMIIDWRLFHWQPLWLLQFRLRSWLRSWLIC